MLTEHDKQYYTRFMTMWSRSDRHMQGCMIEGLLTEKWQLSPDGFENVLRGIAASMK